VVNYRELIGLFDLKTKVETSLLSAT